ncbi:hypothetical protein AQJ43_23090 [Streptomyces avermitilis]|nr:hypothetical protein AQJ43_23090 [Streptomyces avermitilis]
MIDFANSGLLRALAAPVDREPLPEPSSALSDLVPEQPVARERESMDVMTATAARERAGLCMAVIFLNRSGMR